MYIYLPSYCLVLRVYLVLVFVCAPALYKSTSLKLFPTIQQFNIRIGVLQVNVRTQTGPFKSIFFFYSSVREGLGFDSILHIFFPLNFCIETIEENRSDQSERPHLFNFVTLLFGKYQITSTLEFVCFVFFISFINGWLIKFSKINLQKKRASYPIYIRFLHNMS